MGQYHYVVNVTKKQYLHPHKFNEGLKLLEFGCSANGTMTALALLLAVHNGRGGGDLNTSASNDPLIGSWAGDDIAIVGDYGDAKGDKYKGVSHKAGKKYEDISAAIIKVMCTDDYIAEKYR